MLGTKVHTGRDVAAVTGRAFIGEIGFEEGRDSQPVFLTDHAGGTRAEAARRLRTKLQFITLADPAEFIVVTSSVPGEGKTTITINLALADTGARVVLVDADLRRVRRGAPRVGGPGGADHSDSGGGVPCKNVPHDNQRNVAASMDYWARGLLASELRDVEIVVEASARSIGRWLAE